MARDITGVNCLIRGNDVSIGSQFTARVGKLVLGNGVKIGRAVKLVGNHIEIGEACVIDDDVTIEVRDRFILGPRSVIGKHTTIAGRDIEIGAELWTGIWVTIGAGSCYEVQSSLKMGYWCHLGDYSVINTARPVTIGNEVGLGRGTQVITHGAYQSVLQGFPVEFSPVDIGDNCWLPNAMVLPGVRIAKNTVVAAGAVVTKDLPEGCLAGGVPAKIIKSNAYPRQRSREEIASEMRDFLKTFSEMLADGCQEVVYTGGRGPVVSLSGATIVYQHKPSSSPADGKRAIIIAGSTCPFSGPEITVVDLEHRTMRGKADDLSERLRNQLRRYGVRFKVIARNGQYTKWDD